MNDYALFNETKRQRVSDGTVIPLLSDCESGTRKLVLVWSQLGDFDSLEYAWWLQREATRLQQEGLVIRAVGIGDRTSGQRFCQYTGFPEDWLFVDPKAELHRQLNLYPGLSIQLPGLSPQKNAWLNLLLMCAGIGSEGTLTEVFRGYRGDRQAPQLIDDEDSVQPFAPLAIKGSFFNLAGGRGFQRPFELATLRLRNMVESLSHWKTYVPDATYLTQRGGTFLFDAQGTLLYQYCDRGLLGFASNMSDPLCFLRSKE